MEKTAGRPSENTSVRFGFRIDSNELNNQKKDAGKLPTSGSVCPEGEISSSIRAFFVVSA